MHEYLPIKFPEGHLGDRHKFLNERVRKAFENNVPFEMIKKLPETSVVDRFFKIDFASKVENVDYIIENFKDMNILIVSRALKSTWLITNPQYKHIINPEYVEDKLFTEMSTTAANKMLHCIFTNLKDETRCQSFYEYYKFKNDLKIAKHFLPKCPQNVIMDDIELFINDLSPHYLKMLCEKCPNVYKKYFEIVENNDKAFRNFNSYRKDFFNVSRVILKMDPEMYFEILEKYDFGNGFRLSSKATRHVIEKYKDRYMAKPELYGGVLLNLQTLAECLRQDELKDLVERLATAEYIKRRFTLTYKSAEPLLKRLNKEERYQLVKKIFKEKDFERILEASYPLPVELKVLDNDQSILLDHDSAHVTRPKKKWITARKKKLAGRLERSVLVESFNKYRFMGFSQTLYELRKRLQVENLHQNRMMILNVLVSKTLKRAENIQAVLELVKIKHSNEPGTVRASCIRSLVRRAAAYRLPDEPWQIFYEMVLRIMFKSENRVPCDEGIHAIVMHNIINDLDIPPEVINEYLKVFNTLIEYDLTLPEKQKIYNYLYRILVIKSENHLQCDRFEDAKDIVLKIFDLVRDHKVKLEDCSELLQIVKRLAEHDFEHCDTILNRVYAVKACRRLFVKEMFLLNKNGESYINALRHDISLLSEIESFKKIINYTESGKKFDNFLMKLKIYFPDLASELLLVIEKNAEAQLFDNVGFKLAREICILQKPVVLWPIIEDLCAKGKGKRRLAERLAANVHMAYRSSVGVQDKIHKDVGVIATVNALSVFPARAVRTRLPELLSGSPSFIRLAVFLSIDRLKSEDILNATAHVRRNSSTKTKKRVLIKLYKHICLKNDRLETEIWQETKIFMLDLIKNYHPKLWYMICGLDNVPDTIKAEYCMTLMKINSSEEFKLSKHTELNVMLKFIGDNLDRIDEDEIFDVLQRFVQNEFQREDIIMAFEDCYRDINLNSKIKVMNRFLLMSKTENAQKVRCKTILEPFMDKVRSLWSDKEDDIYYKIQHYFDHFLFTLKYNKAYLNTDYVTCIPVLEIVVNYMHTFLDIKKYVYLYSNIHLTMIYHKTLRFIRTQHPNVLSEGKNKIDVAAAVGAVFGRYLAREHLQLLADYFPSMTEIYVDEVQNYILSYNFGSGSVFRKFVMSIIKGFIASDKDENVFFAALLFFDMKWHKEMNDPGLKEIRELIEIHKSMQTQCCISSYSQIRNHHK